MMSALLIQIQRLARQTLGWSPSPVTVVAILAMLLALSPSSSHAGLTRNDLSAIAMTPEIGSNARFDLSFQRSNGSLASLATIAGSKPALLTFADFDCPSLCGVALAALSQRLMESRLTLGEDFELLVVGLDARDDFSNLPNLIASAGSAWTILDRAHFLTSDQARIDQLADAVGYTYQFDRENDVFAHPNGVLLVGANGTILSAFNEFSTSAEAIDDAIEGRGALSQLGQLIRSVCYNYDPLSGQYTLAITRVLKILGTVFVLMLGGLLVLAHRRERAAHV